MKKFNRSILTFMCITIVLVLSAVPVSATDYVDSEISSNPLTIFGDNEANCVLLPNEDVIQIPADAVIHPMVPTAPGASMRGSSPPTAQYDYSWNGPYYFSGTAPTGVNYFTNYLVYGATNYKMQITNRGSQPASAIVCAQGPIPLGAITVPAGRTLTLQFTVSSSTRVYVVASSAYSPLNITGSLYV